MGSKETLVIKFDMFLKNKKEAKNYLAQHGSSETCTNKGVTISYDHIAKNDALFICFSAAILGSFEAGKDINLTENAVLAQCNNTVALSKGAHDFETCVADIFEIVVLHQNILAEVVAIVI